jgi:hypothetical protein
VKHSCLISGVNQIAQIFKNISETNDPELTHVCLKALLEFLRYEEFDSSIIFSILMNQLFNYSESLGSVLSCISKLFKFQKISDELIQPSLTLAISSLENSCSFPNYFIKYFSSLSKYRPLFFPFNFLYQKAQHYLQNSLNVSLMKALECLSVFYDDNLNEDLNQILPLLFLKSLQFCIYPMPPGALYGLKQALKHNPAFIFNNNQIILNYIFEKFSENVEPRFVASDIQHESLLLYFQMSSFHSFELLEFHSRYGTSLFLDIDILTEFKKHFLKIIFLISNAII